MKQLPLILLKTLNWGLTAYVIITCLMIIISPYTEQVKYTVAQSSETVEDKVVYKSNLALELNADEAELVDVPDFNALVMPDININGNVAEGEDLSVLNDNSFWRIPESSTPDQGGNTVIVGHRFLYNSRDTQFYHLDKAEIGQKMALFWDGVEYNYEISEIFEVDIDEVWVEEPTEEPVLTMYTCTPILTATHRLVVRAKPITL